jgi:hypothetical protein
MDQVDPNSVNINLDMRLLDQYRVCHDRYAKAEDLIKMMVDKIDDIVSKFNIKQRSRVFYIRLKTMKIQAIVQCTYESDEKKQEIRVSLNSSEATKAFNLNKIKNQIFEDSLFKSGEGRNVKNDFKEAKVSDATYSDSCNVLRQIRYTGRGWKKPKKPGYSRNKKSRKP